MRISNKNCENNFLIVSRAIVANHEFDFLFLLFLFLSLEWKRQVEKRKKNEFRFPLSCTRVQTDWTVSDKIWNETDVILPVRGNDAKAKVRTIWPLKWRAHTPAICTAHTTGQSPSLSGVAFDARSTGDAQTRCAQATDDWQKRERESCAAQRTRARSLALTRERNRIVNCVYRLSRVKLNDGKYLTAENFNYSNEHELLHIFLLPLEFCSTFFPRLHNISANGYTLSMAEHSCMPLTSHTPHITWMPNERRTSKNTSINLMIVAIVVIITIWSGRFVGSWQKILNRS